MLVQPSVDMDNLFQKIFGSYDDVPEMHRNIFRGKNLGSVYTDEQKAAIKDGSFHDIFVGDYWEIKYSKWRVADINYWINRGSTRCTTNHVVLVPDGPLYSTPMDESSYAKAYTNTQMYTTGLDKAKNTINDAFGEGYVLKHDEFLATSSVYGFVNNANWTKGETTVDLMNEFMVFGHPIVERLNEGGSTYPHSNCTIDNTQLALFRLAPSYIMAYPFKQGYWLKDPSRSSCYAVVMTDVSVSPGQSQGNTKYGVRPVFGITGGA